MYVERDGISVPGGRKDLDSKSPDPVRNTKSSDNEVDTSKDINIRME